MLRIVDVIETLICQVRPLADAVGRKDLDLAKQLRRALSSVLLNIGEGSDQRGARRTNHYAIALGSAQEALLALRAAQAWGYIGAIPEEVDGNFKRVIGTLVKVAR